MKSFSPLLVFLTCSQGVYMSTMPLRTTIDVMKALWTVLIAGQARVDLREEQKREKERKVSKKRDKQAAQSGGPSQE